MSRRPAYITERIVFEEARRKARRTHPQPCDCPYCITPERADEIIKARVARARELVGEPPF